jgi:hypothetical protein
MCGNRNESFGRPKSEFRVIGGMSLGNGWGEAWRGSENCAHHTPISQRLIYPDILSRVSWHNFCLNLHHN